MIEIGREKEARVIKGGLCDKGINSGEVEFRYLRCRLCGFTIRRFPQGALIVVVETTEDLQRIFNRGFQIVSGDNPGSF